MRVLVAGGAGYIGSVAVRYLLAAGHEVCVYDNLLTGHRESVPAEAKLIVSDLSESNDLKSAFRSGFDAVMHFAALSLVSDSVQNPALYFENNIANGIKLLNAMKDSSVNKLIFSSTAAVYGETKLSPITEDFELSPANPYGETKVALEKMFKWYEKAYGLKHVSLRYFNAAGAFGDAGEDHAHESHLIPLVLQVAQGKREQITIFGDDYPTQDGTCIRDYIHVKDLADAHLKAIDALNNGSPSDAFNLGQGAGTSVKQIIDAARKITGKPIPAQVSGRRAGDPSILVASNEKIAKHLNWHPRCSQIETIIADAWAWHQAHPNGYSGAKSFST